MARQASTVSWQVKALVEATPISGPGERRQDRVGFARDRGFAHIDDRQDVLALRAAIAQRGERIGGLARLRDEQRRAAGIERASRDSGTRRRYRHRPAACAQRSNQYLATRQA